MFELMIGIDGVQRRTDERLKKRRRGDDGEGSRLRAVFARRAERPDACRPSRFPLTQPR